MYNEVARTKGPRAGLSNTLPFLLRPRGGGGKKRRASFLSPPGAGDNIVDTRIVSPTRGIDSMETPNPTTKDDSVFPLRRGEGSVSLSGE